METTFPLTGSFARREKVVDIAQSPHHIAFFTGPAYVFIVSVSAFPSVSGFADTAQTGVFLETARTYRRSARDGSAPVLPTPSAACPPPPQRSA